MGEIVTGVFLMIFGCIFGGMPLGVMTSFLMINDEMFIPVGLFLSIFVIVGASIFIFGLRMIINHFKKKKIKENGTLTKATFVRMGSNLTKNSTQYYYIVFKYNDANGYEKTYKTGHDYSFEEANYYASIKQFNIRYKGKMAVIVEEIDHHKMHQLTPQKSYSGGLLGTLLNTLNPNATSTQEQQPLEYYYTCEYCNNIQDKPGKCKHCGAKINPQNKMIK